MIVAGFGFRKSAKLGALRDALAVAQRDHPPVAALAAPANKLALVSQLAEAMGVPMIAVSPEDLQAPQTPTRSLASLTARSTGSVAEASALAAAGPGAHLLAIRQISSDRMATCAIAASSALGPVT